MSFANSAMTVAHEVSRARESINIAEKRQQYRYMRVIDLTCLFLERIPNYYRTQ